MRTRLQGRALQRTRTGLEPVLCPQRPYAVHEDAFARRRACCSEDVGAQVLRWCKRVRFADSRANPRSLGVGSKRQEERTLE